MYKPFPKRRQKGPAKQVALMCLIYKSGRRIDPKICKLCVGFGAIRLNCIIDRLRVSDDGHRDLWSRDMGRKGFRFGALFRVMKDQHPRHPTPSTLNPKPSNLNRQPQTLNPQP